VSQVSAEGTPVPQRAPRRAAPRRAELRKARRVRRMINNVGEVLITLGVVLILYSIYQLLWTNIETGFAQNSLRDDLVQAWRDPPREPRAVQAPPPALGEAVAIIHIPRLGSDFSRVVVEGVRVEDLARGPGHYPGTALPGQVGNFAVAGHRATNGEPFRKLDRLAKGDAVLLETRDAYYTYVVDSSEIVEPAQVGVILPVPNEPGAQPERPLITLTTCHPRWASTHRLIVYGHLAAEQPKSAGPPAVLDEG
jgi:sortase A